jgi:hypothetical protein
MCKSGPKNISVSNCRVLKPHLFDTGENKLYDGIAGGGLKTKKRKSHTRKNKKNKK